MASRISRAADVWFILDEVQANFGRTGAMYAFDSYGVEPDVVEDVSAGACAHPCNEMVIVIAATWSTAESASATVAMENAGEPDDAFGSGADSVGRGVEARTSLITHGGEIDVASRPGMGTTITVALPRKVAQVAGSQLPVASAVAR